MATEAEGLSGPSHEHADLQPSATVTAFGAVELFGKASTTTIEAARQNLQRHSPCPASDAETITNRQMQLCSQMKFADILRQALELRCRLAAQRAMLLRIVCGRL